MPESDDASTARIEAVLAEAQRQERAEEHAEIARQVEADRRVADAIAKQQRQD